MCKIESEESVMDDLNCSMYKRLVILKWSYGGHHFVKNLLTNILLALVIFSLKVSVRYICMCSAFLDIHSNL